MNATDSHEVSLRGTAGIDDAATFAADIVLLGAFVISIGIPLYHTYGFIRYPQLIAWYVASAALLPLVLPLFVWTLRWGVPSRDMARRLARGSLLYSVPVLLCVGAIVHAGLDVGLTGVAVMTFIAAVLVSIVHVPLTRFTDRPQMIVIRVAVTVLTPVIVLGFTDALPQGLEAIQGWGIPMPVLVAGAFGCSRVIRKSMTRDAERAAV